MDYKRPITVNGVSVSLQGHTHNFSTFPVLCAKVGKSAIQSYSANAITKVIFDTAILNNGLTVDTTNSRIKMPSTLSGVGIFEIQVNIQLSGTSTMTIYVYKNGSLLETIYNTTNTSDEYICSAIEKFAANDYIEIYLKGGTARTIQAATTSYIKQVA
jgi:hypothetical protein